LEGKTSASLREKGRVSRGEVQGQKGCGESKADRKGRWKKRGKIDGGIIRRDKGQVSSGTWQYLCVSVHASEEVGPRTLRGFPGRSRKKGEGGGGKRRKRNTFSQERRAWQGYSCIRFIRLV